MRLARLSMESVINSNVASQYGYPGTGPGAASYIMPWVETARTTVDGSPILNTDYDLPVSCGNARSKTDLRAMLAMLRAKNVPAIIGWTNQRPGATFPCDTEVGSAWRDTQLVVEQVYNARIYNYFIARGSTPTGSSEDFDTSRLEFTLRDEELHDRTVSITSAETLAPGGLSGDGAIPIAPHESALIVDFIWTQPERLHSPAQIDINTNGTGDLDMFLVNVECDTNASDANGRVFAWCPSCASGHPGWVEADYAEPGNIPNQNSLYSFPAPHDDASSHPTIHSRRSFVFHSPSIYYTDTSDGTVHSKLLLEHYASSGFTSSFDLVQIIPVGINGLTHAPIAAADINGDGVIDDLDIAAFIEAFEIEDPIGDMNADGIVDGADYELFFGSVGG